MNRPPSLIARFAANPVAANLLMWLILAGGVLGFKSVDKEVFPRLSPRQIVVTALYPGVGPLEMEESVCIRIEEAIYDLPGVQRLNAEISQGECSIKVAVLADRNLEQMMGAVRSKIQAIQRLPRGLEKIEVGPGTRNDDDGVLWVALHGPAEALALKRLGDRIQEDLARIPGVTRAKNYNDVPYEIAIELPSAKLRQYGLSLGEVAAAVRRASLDLAGGLVKNPAGELLLRVKGKAQDAAALAALTLRENPDGSRLSLGEVAKISDGLEERVTEWHHNGETAQGWEIHADHDTVEVARRVKAYIAQKQAELPEGLTLKAWWDDSQAYEERIDTLLEDGLSGFALVCVVLTLFLRLRVALWAGAGILTSVMGALWLMPVLGVSLNMLSLFGFLLAMGILVDDAIIIGEGVHSKQVELQGEADAGLRGAILGAEEVALPVTLSVLVALAAFLPGLFLPGWSGQMMKPICVVMILTLVFSLVEALLILPAHLAHAPVATPNPGRLERLRDWLNGGLDRFVATAYRPLLRHALAWRYLTVALFAALVICAVALVAGHRVRQSLSPDVTKDSFWVYVTLPQSAPYREAQAASKQVEDALFSLRDEIDTRQRALGAQSSVIVGVETMVWEHAAGLWVEFSPLGRQRIPVEGFIRDWRSRIGDLGRAKIDFMYKEGDEPYDLEFYVGAADPKDLDAAAAAVKDKLASYAGVFDVADASEPGKPEVRLGLKPAAERLGLRLEDLAEQVRHGYFGEEVQRLQRGRSEVKIMVRHPREERESLDTLRQLPVRLAAGGQVPLADLAELRLTPGLARLYRQDRQRIIKVMARVDPQKGDVNAIYADMETQAFKTLRQRFPGINLSIGQERQEQDAMTAALSRYTLLALLVIYALIAIPFRSYTKPLIFLLAAPVAWSGAVLAHWLVGLPLSMESLVGMIAASGVVVNDSLVLLDYVREREARPGAAPLPASELVLEACAARFRPILLAFLTNFAGFLPTLLETSAQAQFLIPMTLSLSAGLLVGMAASLLLTPICHAILEEG